MCHSALEGKCHFPPHVTNRESQEAPILKLAKVNDLDELSPLLKMATVNDLDELPPVVVVENGLLHLLRCFDMYAELGVSTWWGYPSPKK